MEYITNFYNCISMPPIQAMGEALIYKSDNKTKYLAKPQEGVHREAIMAKNCTKIHWGITPWHSQLRDENKD